MKRLFALISILGILVIATPAVLAAPGDFKIENPLGSRDLDELIGKLTDALRNLAIPVGVVMILWGGFNYLTAAGNPTKIQKANKILLYTAIGLAVVFIGGGFVDLIKSIIGASNNGVQQLPIQDRNFNQLP